MPKIKSEISDGAISFGFEPEVIRQPIELPKDMPQFFSKEILAEMEKKKKKREKHEKG